MLIVTGTKRSGTSAWMQILVAGGFKYIGQKFPRNWAEVIGEANPDGFYESSLCRGVNFQTNPDPKSGDYLFPTHTALHAVKIFIPGLVRTDVAFIDRVIATVRDWREYTESVLHLRGLAAPEHDEKRVLLAPELEWWQENFALIRDIATRCYPVHAVTYESLLDDPTRTVKEVFQWIGAGDAIAGIDVVKPERRTKHSTKLSDMQTSIDKEHTAIFDEIYHRIHRGVDLSPILIRKMNETDTALRPRFIEYQASVQMLELERMVERAPLSRIQ